MLNRIAKLAAILAALVTIAFAYAGDDQGAQVAHSMSDSTEKANSGDNHSTVDTTEKISQGKDKAVPDPTKQITSPNPSGSTTPPPVPNNQPSNKPAPKTFTVTRTVYVPQKDGKGEGRWVQVTQTLDAQGRELNAQGKQLEAQGKQLGEIQTSIAQMGKLLVDDNGNSVVVKVDELAASQTAHNETEAKQLDQVEKHEGLGMNNIWEIIGALALGGLALKFLR